MMVVGGLVVVPVRPVRYDRSSQTAHECNELAKVGALPTSWVPADPTC